MQRRKFIHKGALLTSAFLAGAKSTFAVNGGSAGARAVRCVASGSSSPMLSVPAQKRVPLGWRALGVAAKAGEAATILHFDALDARRPVTAAYLRITAALDFREEKIVRASLAGSGTELGHFIMKFAHPFQPFEIPVEAKFLDAIRREGVALAMTRGEGDAWFFSEDRAVKDNLALQPHLLIGTSDDKLRDFRANLYSMNSFSPFGWMGGCVLDALHELRLLGDKRAGDTLMTQLSRFLDDQKGIIFENPHTIPLDGTFNSIEDFLPLPAIAGLYPGHPSVEKSLEFLLRLKDQRGIIFNQHITTEGCYTVGYPLAVVAAMRKDPALAQVALDQICHRIDHLAEAQQNSPAVYQRADADGARSYRNWGRGVAWFLLGSVKTYRALHSAGYGRKEDMEKVKAALAFHLPLITAMQDRQGLWAAYLDRPETGPDTSATGGIAAALAWACEAGILQRSRYLPVAEAAYAGLQPHLSADGFLRNVTQINRGGEDLQESGYRVISQFAMGLMGQLEAALRRARA